MTLGSMIKGLPLIMGGESMKYTGSQAAHENLLQAWRGLSKSQLTERSSLGRFYGALPQEGISVPSEQPGCPRREAEVFSGP